MQVFLIPYNFISMIKKVTILSIAVILFMISCDKKEEASYMGSRSCKECHQNFYDLWESSYHGRAMMDYSKDFAAHHLSECEDYIQVGGDAYKYDEGKLIERSTKRSYPIRHVLGGKSVYYFLTPPEKGKLPTLPLGYDAKNKERFDITTSSLRIHQDINDEALPWTDRQYTFNTACFSCHVSQLSTQYNISDDSYHTTWLEPGINCETCHGPAEKHNTAFLEAKMTGIVPDSSFIRTYTQDRGYSADIVNATCGYCHAKSISITDGYVVGDDFFDHFDLVGPEHPDFYPDGRDLGENYTYSTWLMSPCVRNSDMDCLHCHTSSGRYKQKDDPNASCLPCHAERVANATRHTRHKESSPGNQCIKCHMPKTSFARMQRSDHSLRPPAPAATIAYGSPNACNNCHRRKSPEWAESFVREHYSGKWQDEIMRWAEYLDQLRQGKSDNLNDILPDMIRPVDEVTLSALIRSLRQVRDERIITLCYYFSTHESPLVRSSALTTLADYDEEIVRQTLFKACADPVRLVRVRAAAELLNIPEDEIPSKYREYVIKSINEYKNSLNAYPDREISHYNLGHFHENRHDDAEAVRDYKRALRLRPEMTEASVNLGMIYYRNGIIDSALYYFQNAVVHDPLHVEANLNLGLLFNELGYRKDAVKAFETAFEDGKSPVAAYNLAVLLSRDDPESSLNFARSANNIDPRNPKYVYTYAYYLHEAGQTQNAVEILERALSHDIRSFDIYYFLGTIYKQTQDIGSINKLMDMINGDMSISDREKRYLKFEN